MRAPRAGGMDGVGHAGMSSFPFLNISGSATKWQQFLDRITPHPVGRWVFFAFVALLYAVRVYFLRGFYSTFTFACPRTLARVFGPRALRMGVRCVICARHTPRDTHMTTLFAWGVCEGEVEGGMGRQRTRRSQNCKLRSKLASSRSLPRALLRPSRVTDVPRVRALCGASLGEAGVGEMLRNARSQRERACSSSAEREHAGACCGRRARALGWRRGFPPHQTVSAGAGVRAEAREGGALAAISREALRTAHTSGVFGCRRHTPLCCALSRNTARRNADHFTHRPPPDLRPLKRATGSIHPWPTLLV